MNVFEEQINIILDRIEDAQTQLWEAQGKSRAGFAQAADICAASVRSMLVSITDDLLCLLNNKERHGP